MSQTCFGDLKHLFGCHDIFVRHTEAGTLPSCRAARDAARRTREGRDLHGGLVDSLVSPFEVGFPLNILGGAPF